MTIEKNEGLIVAPFTPMQANGDINFSAIPNLYSLYRSQGLKGVFINGSTSEGLSLTTKERKQLAEAWKKEVAADFALMVHVGHTSLKEAQELAAHAAALDVSGIATVGPFYMLPETVEDLVAFCTDIAAAAPQTPFYFYHIPALTGIKFPMVDFLRLASKQIPTLAGIKYTDNNFIDFDRCQHFDEGKYDILFGFDELMISGRLFGARGFVGSTYNLFPRLYFEIIDAFDRGDLPQARLLQRKSIAFVHAINKYGYNGAAKALMQYFGVDCGPVRPPLKNITPEQLTQLKEELIVLGFFEYAPVQVEAE